MGQVAVRLPDVFDALPEKEKQAILNMGIKKSIEERVNYPVLKDGACRQGRTVYKFLFQGSS